MNYNSIIMEYQKTHLLKNTPNQLTKFRRKNLIEVNDESRDTYNVNSQIKFKTSMLKLRFCDYSDAYTPVSPTTTVPNTAAARATANNMKNVIIKKLCFIH